MKVLAFTWRMAMRRKAACLLVVVSTMVTTVFMLFYPGLIRDTRMQLEETYAGITVTGSIITAELRPQPAISNGTWKVLKESNYFSQLYASSYFSIRTFPKDILEKEAGTDASEQRKLVAFQNLLAGYEKEDSGGVGGTMAAYNTFQAAKELIRIQDDIRWLEGYDESYLEGNERVCIVPEKWGYALGDTVPFLARPIVSNDYVEGIFRLKVVGTYPGKITKFTAFMPIQTMEDLTVDATAAQKQISSYQDWSFSLEEVYFTVRDNRQLDEIKP